MNTSPPAHPRRRPARARLRAALLCLALCVPVWLPEPVRAATDAAGMVIAVRQEARALRSPGAEVLKSKSPVHAGDVVHTNSAGRLQILFRDNSALTMAPDTQVTISKYVDAGESTRGEAAMQIAVTRGLTRFMSGDIVRVRPGAMQVETPRAVLDIRGTVVDVDVAPLAPCGVMERYALIETTSPQGLLIRVRATGESVLLEEPGMEVAVLADGSVRTSPLSMTALKERQASLALGTGGKKEGTFGGTGSPDLLLAALTRDNAQGFLPRTPEGVIRPVEIPVAPTFSGNYSGPLSGTWSSGTWNGAFTIGIGDLGGAFAVNSVNVFGANQDPSQFGFSLTGARPNLIKVGAGGAFAFTATNTPPWVITSNTAPISSINVKGQIAGSSMNLDVEGVGSLVNPPFSGSGTGTRQ